MSSTRGHGEDRPRASVSIRSHPLWRIRLVREGPRYLLCAASLAGLLASARFAIAPPSPPAAVAHPLGATPDRAAEGYAALFARRYLSWDAAADQPYARALEPFLGSAIEADAGLVLPASGEQRVAWVEVVQAREPAAGVHVYTLAAQTDSAGLLFLTVGVQRSADGALQLSGYPAFVGPPASEPARGPAQLQEVSDARLATVVQRALRNYLGDAPGELAADLAAGARVSLPSLALTIDSLLRLDWSTPGRSVQAVLQAHDARGVQYTLAYELDVVRVQGRWEIAAVQMDPDT